MSHGAECLFAPRLGLRSALRVVGKTNHSGVGHVIEVIIDEKAFVSAAAVERKKQHHYSNREPKQYDSIRLVQRSSDPRAATASSPISASVSTTVGRFVPGAFREMACAVDLMTIVHRLRRALVPENLSLNLCWPE